MRLSALPNPGTVCYVVRENGVRLRDEPAPRGWTYCALCRGYQHPKFHDIVWREAQMQNNASLANLWSYTQRPETPTRAHRTRHYEPS